MDFKDEKNMNNNAAEQESKISDEAASALESGLFEEKDGSLGGESAQPEAAEATIETAEAAETADDGKKQKPQKKSRKNPFASRKFKKGSFAVILTCLVVACVIVINIIVNVLQSKIPVFSIDMTGQNLYELSDSSKEIVDKVDKDITITVLGAEDAYTMADQNFLQANNLLKKYAMENSRIKIEYVDLAANPNYINNYPNENLSIYSYIVGCGNKDDKDYRYKYLDKSTELFMLGTDYTSGETYVESSNVESAVTSAISYVTSEKTTKVALLEGFGDDSSGIFDSFTSLLKSNNYETVEVNLLTGEISSDCDMAVLFQPTSDLTDEAVDKISDYLNNGGKYGKNLFYVPPTAKVDSPNTDAFLAEWGMSVGQGIVAETDSAHMPYNGDYYCSIYDYENGSEYLEGLKDTTKYFIGVYTRPIMIDDDTMVKSLATTSESSAMSPMDADENWNPLDHIEGSFNAGAISTKTSGDSKSTVTAWGSAMSFYGQWLNSNIFINGEYFVNLFNILTNREDTGVVIDSKSVQAEQLGIMSDQINVIGPIFMWVIPIIVAAIGIIVFIRRRHR